MSILFSPSMERQLANIVIFIKTYLMNTYCRSAKFVNIESYSRAKGKEVNGKEKPRRRRGHCRFGCRSAACHRIDSHVRYEDLGMYSDGYCDGKQKFRSDASARRRARYLKLTGSKEDRGQHPYKCKLCGAWHLTSARSRDGKDYQKRRNRRSHYKN